jgi:hypothetical protein
MMEQLLLEYGKEGIFFGLFVWLLYWVLQTSKAREDKLYQFLDDMKVVYEGLANDVADIKTKIEK